MNKNEEKNYLLKRKYEEGVEALEVKLSKGKLHFE